MYGKYEWLDSYLLSKPGAVSAFKAEWQWLRYLVCDKQFAAVCTPGEKHKEHAGRPMVILKCDPLLAETLRAEYKEIVPGFYSDKRNWNSVYLDGHLKDDFLRHLCDMSYQLVFDKLRQKDKREILGQDL